MEHGNCTPASTVCISSPQLVELREGHEGPHATAQFVVGVRHEKDCRGGRHIHINPRRASVCGTRGMPARAQLRPHVASRVRDQSRDRMMSDQAGRAGVARPP